MGKIENFVARFFDSFTSAIARLNPWTIIVSVVVLMCFSLSLRGNEEQYLTLAKQYMAPNWIPNSINLTEPAGARFLYQWVIGFLLQFVSVEVMAQLGKFLALAVIAASMVKLYRLFGFTNFDILLQLPVLYMGHQAFFAGEYILLTFESKTFAYILVFYSLYFAFQDQTKKSLVFAALATYCHVLVGGWFAVYLLIFQFWNSNWSLSRFLKGGLLYAAMVAPVVGYLVYEILFKAAAQSGSVSIGWIYSYYRAPHHLAPLKSSLYFFENHFSGVLLSFLTLTACFFLFNKLKTDVGQKINKFVIVATVGVLFFLILSPLDQSGSFLKFYLFRINGITAFLVCVMVVMFLKEFMLDKVKKEYPVVVLLLAMYFVFTKMVYQVVDSRKVFTKSAKEFNLISNYIRLKTPKQSKFLYLDRKFDGYLSFNRKTERDRFVVRKFIPSGTSKVYDWYERILEKRKFVRNRKYLPVLRSKYQIDYILSHRPMKLDGLRLIKKEGRYHLYRLANKTLAMKK